MRLSGLKRFMIIVSALVIFSAFIHYVLIPNPSSPFFSPYRFKSIFYSQESINQIFRDRTYPGMGRDELEKIIFRCGGYPVSRGDSVEKRKQHSGLGYSILNEDKLAGAKLLYYINYTLPSIGIPDLSTRRRISAHFNEQNSLEVLFINGNLIIPH